jgi:hypothetical protein
MLSAFPAPYAGTMSSTSARMNQGNESTGAPRVQHTTVMTSEGRTAKERVASNEAVFRRINESVEADYSETNYGGRIGFLCECGHPGCEEPIEMTRREYESVREHSRRFAVIADHAIETTEDIVERNQGYAVVEKHEDVSDLVERSDPRR